MPPSTANRTARVAPTYQDVLAKDPKGVPEVLRPHTVELGDEPVSAARYTSADFFRKEVEKVWLKTWQYACREEEIPSPGDTYVFDLVGKTVIVARQPDGSIKAMLNVCPHRGRKIVTTDACLTRFRCLYHGLTWNLDGSVRESPFNWDFSQESAARLALSTVRLESWAGFIFLNFDHHAPPLLEQLAPMPDHFERWHVKEWYKEAHVGKLVPANWKACAEAFLEAYHILATHPQANAINGYDSGQYDILSDHVTRHAGPSGITPSTHPEELDDARRVEIMNSFGGRMGAGAGPTMAYEAGMTSRSYAGEVARRQMAARTGYDFDDVCEAELIDGISYDFFPNFHLWGGYNGRICYRFRPDGLNHEQTFMEVMIFRLAPKGKPKPAPARMRILSVDEAWESATELGYLAGVYDQDESNLGPVQEGLRALGDSPVNFSRYLDARCRHLHQMIDVYMQR